MDFTLKSEISIALKRTKLLLDSKIMWDKPTLFFRQSVLIEILINLKDLLVKADKLGYRIDFTDDIIPDSTLKIKDVTDLISNFRDAACHNDSFRRKIDEGFLSFNEIRGKANLFQINNVIIGGSYEDDIAFNMGRNTLYLKRHIERAFTEVETVLEPLAR